MDPARRKATYEDLLAVPDHLIAEIIDGELVTSPRPGAPHARAASRLGMEVGGPFDRGRGGPGGWIILDEPELHFHDQVLVPDLAGWRRERMPTLPEGVSFELAPDWVCEVLSPSTARLDRTAKRATYAREGVRHLWFVDPVERLLEVFRLENGQYVVAAAFSDDALIRAEPFDAIQLELGALWER
jgi:Uma2 family endonuclease